MKGQIGTMLGLALNVMPSRNFPTRHNNWRRGSRPWLNIGLIKPQKVPSSSYSYFGGNFQRNIRNRCV